MDIFGGWKNYQTLLEQNWRERIAPEDMVVLAGDFSWGMNLQQAEADFAFVQNLPGKKILLKGITITGGPRRKRWKSSLQHTDLIPFPFCIIIITRLTNTAFAERGDG